MANTYLTISKITNKALFTLENELVATKTINREYSKEFAVKGAKIGNTINIRKPARPIVSDGPALVIQDFEQEQVPLTLSNQKHVGMTFTSADLLLSLDDFNDNVIQPSVAPLANAVDASVLSLYRQVSQYVGTAGTVPANDAPYLNAGVRLDNSAVPRDGNRYNLMSPQGQATLIHGLSGLFNAPALISRQYEKGEMPDALGFRNRMDQNVRTHVIGAIAGTPTVNGAGQTGANILTQAWGALATLREGDVIEFASVFGVNPQSRDPWSILRPFVVTQDVAADGAGALTIPIDPPITVAGGFQTVNASPGNGAAITVFGVAPVAGVFANTAASTPQGMAYHKDAFSLGSADLPLPRNVHMAARAAHPKVGLSLRIVQDYIITSDEFPCRVDVLYGVASLRRDLACRLLN